MVFPVIREVYETQETARRPCPVDDELHGILVCSSLQKRIFANGLVIVSVDFEHTSSDCEGFVLRLRARDRFAGVCPDVRVGRDEPVREQSVSRCTTLEEILALLNVKRAGKVLWPRNAKSGRAPTSGHFLLAMLSNRGGDRVQKEPPRRFAHECITEQDSQWPYRAAGLTFVEKGQALGHLLSLVAQVLPDRGHNRVPQPVHQGGGSPEGKGERIVGAHFKQKRKMLWHALSWNPDTVFEELDHACFLALSHASKSLRELCVQRSQYRIALSARTRTRHQNLLKAARRGDLPKIVSLARGVVLNPPAPTISPLMCAVLHGHCSAVELLIDLHGSVLARDRHGYTALGRAIFHHASPDVVRLLLHAKSTPNGREEPHSSINLSCMVLASRYSRAKRAEILRILRPEGVMSQESAGTAEGVEAPRNGLAASDHVLRDEEVQGVGFGGSEAEPCTDPSGGAGERKKGRGPAASGYGTQ